MIPNFGQICEVVLESNKLVWVWYDMASHTYLHTEWALPQTGCFVSVWVGPVKFLALWFAMLEPSDSCHDKFADVECLRRLLCQHVEDFFR